MGIRGHTHNEVQSINCTMRALYTFDMSQIMLNFGEFYALVLWKPVVTRLC